MLLNWNNYSEKKNVLSLLLKKERVAERLSILGEIVPTVRAEVWESAKAMGFVVEALEFEHACVCMTKSGESGKDCKGVVAQKDERGRHLGLRCDTCKQFFIFSVQKLETSGVAVGEVCSFDGVVLW